MDVGKVRMLYGFSSFLFLVAGIGVYFLFRDLSGMVFFAWVPYHEFVGNVHIQLPSSALSNVLMYNTAGMLWFMSGILFFRFLWFRRPKTQKVYIACFCLLAATIEIAQLSGNVPGTFDPLDLLFMGAGALAEGLVYNRPLAKLHKFRKRYAVLRARGS